MLFILHELCTMVLHSIAWNLTVLYGIAWYCVVSHVIVARVSHSSIDTIEVILSDWRDTGAGLSENWKNCWVYAGAL